MGFFKEKATVKMFRPAQDRRKAFAFASLSDNREVYIGQEILEQAGITELHPGQMVKLKHKPSEKRQGGLQATVISA